LGEGRFGVLVTIALGACLALSMASFAEPALVHTGPGEAISGPGGNAWGLIIGIDDYPAPTANTIGSVADARTLASTLVTKGWRPDHLVRLLDGEATSHRVTSALRWLASNTDESSAVVIHYSGHERDGSLLLADNKQLPGRELSNFIKQVRSRSMWIDLIACNAGGLLSGHAYKQGDVATFSSRARQLSFGDTTLGHSIFGHYALGEAIGRALGDANHDGQVSVQEAFAYAQHRVESYTARRQSPRMIDKTRAEFTLEQRGFELRA
jgi:caspase domain-containing protein